ncbi:MAG: glycosyltransferase family 39 protein [Pleurocapsa sp.]
MANLESKIFWVDEIATAVRVSGYTIKEVTNSLINQNILGFDDLLIYQNVTLNKTFFDTWNALIKSPEHAPLYFILTRFWMQIWGSSIAVMRSLSAVLGLLVFPALYWLCQELFDKRFISKIAVILISVSPFYVTYAQEARPYSLWTITILLLGASLLRAIRINDRKSWILYSISLILGLYTSLFCVYIAFFQGIYILLAPIKNKRKIIQQYLLFSFVSFIAFIPWILIIINHLSLLQENTSWMRGNFNLAEIIAVFIGTVLLIFGDLPISQESDPVQSAIALIVISLSYLIILISSRYIQKRLTKLILFFAVSSNIIILFNYIYLDYVSIIGGLVALIILSLSSYSLYYLIIQTNCDRFSFILCLIISLPLPLLIIDIINQGQGSTAPRYLIPLQLGIQIAVAYTIANKLMSSQKPLLWRCIIIGFLILGIFSCIRNFNLSPFYQKGRNINNPAIATIINQSNSPLVIVESAEAMDALSLAYSLSSQTKYKVTDTDKNVIKYLNNFQNIFVLKPSKNFQNRLQQNSKINLQQVYKSHLFSVDEIPLDLWQISKI